MHCVYEPTDFCFAGMNAINYAFDIAYSMPWITHLARLDDDDLWYPDHLSNLAEAFANPEVGYAYSMAAGFRDNSDGYPNIIFKADYDVQEMKPNYYYFPPMPCLLVASTTGWSKTHLMNFKFKNDIEQQMLSRLNGSGDCFIPKFENGTIRTAFVLPGKYKCCQFVNLFSHE